MNCYRHPDKEAKRKCYYCRQPICPTCQVKLSRHIFCSDICHKKWLKREEEKKEQKAESRRKPKFEDRLNMLQKQNDRLSRAVIMLGKRLDSLEQKKEESNKTSRNKFISLAAILALVTAGSLAAGLVWYRANGNGGHEVADTELEAPFSIEEVSYFSSPPTLELAMKNIELTDSSFTLHGEAPGAAEVILFMDGEQVASAAPDGDYFCFEKVNLKLGTNLIQVASEDDEGHRMYSLARLIERVNRYVARVPKLPALNYMRGSRKSREIALTFDAGASANYSAEILRILREKNIRTTIFLTGQFIETYPQVIKQIVADGHEVGNHTYSHLHLTTYSINHRHNTRPGMTREKLQNELTRTADLFTAVTGQEMAPWWRAPYGEQNTKIRRWAEEIGYKHVDWTRGPGRKNYDLLDWVSNERSKHYLTKDEIYARFVNLDDGVPGRANGGIILMHLSTDRKEDLPYQALPLAIDKMREKGYEFVSVSQMFED